LFFLFTFWSNEKLFSSEKKMSWLLAAGLQLFEHQLDLLQSPLLGRLAQKLNPSQCIQLLADILLHFLCHSNLAQFELPCQGPHGPAGVLVNKVLQPGDNAGIQGIAPIPVRFPVGAQHLGKLPGWES
jgi:hypothetical protein